MKDTRNVSKAKIERIARAGWANLTVNSGALLRIDLDEEAVTVAAVDASGHYAPRYPYSAEAPRVYDDAPVTLGVWREWVEQVIAKEQEG